MMKNKSRSDRKEFSLLVEWESEMRVRNERSKEIMRGMRVAGRHAS